MSAFKPVLIHQQQKVAPGSSNSKKQIKPQQGGYCFVLKISKI